MAEKNEVVVGAVTLRSATGKSVLKAEHRITKENINQFMPPEEAVDMAASELEKRGFKIEVKTRISLSISGPKELFEEVFKTTITKEQAEVPVFRGVSRGTEEKVPRKKISYYKSKEPILVIEELADLIEGVTLPMPAVEFSCVATPPGVTYSHLDVPHDISDLMGADPLHAMGIRGEGVRVAMVDSGFWNHPYYAGKGYDITVVPAVVGVGLDTAQDEIGHGTGIAACLLAVAPDITFIFVKYADLWTGFPLQGFQRACTENAKIITCSWGTMGGDPTRPALELEIVNAVENDERIVFFACGNCHNDDPTTPPDQGQSIALPEVISVGGVNPIPSLEASNYASSYDSLAHADRHSPDVCGLTGQQPIGALIMLPTQPGSILDEWQSLGGDGTDRDDCWMVASGTSSASPMVAGVAALLLGEGGRQGLWHEREGDITLGNTVLQYNLQPYEMMKGVLELSATDVTTGTSHHGDSAHAGYDDATGYGLVNAKAAFDFATSAGCLIATAAYRSPFAPEVQFLRNIRDKRLRRTAWGNKTMDTFESIYYKFSPRVASIMIKNTTIRKTVRWLVVSPIVYLLLLSVKIFSSMSDKFGAE